MLPVLRNPVPPGTGGNWAWLADGWVGLYKGLSHGALAVSMRPKTKELKHQKRVLEKPT